jgi:hypothetical protein
MSKLCSDHIADLQVHILNVLKRFQDLTLHARLTCDGRVRARQGVAADTLGFFDPGRPASLRFQDDGEASMYPYHWNAAAPRWLLSAL